MQITSLVLISLLICSTKSARILGVFPFYGRSHYILGVSLMRALAEKGHDVTIISPFKEKTPPNNGSYREIVIAELEGRMEKEKNMFDREGRNPFINLAFKASAIRDFVEVTLKQEQVQKLIHSEEKFDVVIVEQFSNEAHQAFAARFGAPLIIFSSLGANSWTNPLVGNPAPPSYIADQLLGYTSTMTFIERLTNCLFYLLTALVNNLRVLPAHNELIKKYIPTGPHLHDVLYNASIVLLNSHPSINQAAPHVPNMIEIGGFHIKPPENLSQDLQEFMDDAKDGVIYFSMGSHLRSSQMSLQKREAFLKTFGKLKEKVLWKWEEDSLPNQPPNVKLGKWLPQQDILAHPNIKLFITHGGLLSTIETVYHGVPILVIPIYGDQPFNAKTAVDGEFGLSLPYSSISEKKLTERINEILHESKYRDNAKMRARLFHDRLVSPMDTAIYWVEYVIRYKGAPHLRVAGLDLPWYKYHLLDIISFVVLLCLILYITLRKMMIRKKTPMKIKKH